MDRRIFEAALDQALGSNEVIDAIGGLVENRQQADRLSSGLRSAIVAESSELWKAASAEWQALQQSENRLKAELDWAIESMPDIDRSESRSMLTEAIRDLEHKKAEQRTASRQAGERLEKINVRLRDITHRKQFDDVNRNISELEATLTAPRPDDESPSHSSGEERTRQRRWLRSVRVPTPAESRTRGESQVHAEERRLEAEKEQILEALVKIHDAGKDLEATQKNLQSQLEKLETARKELALRGHSGTAWKWPGARRLPLAGSVSASASFGPRSVGAGSRRRRGRGAR